MTKKENKKIDSILIKELQNKIKKLEKEKEEKITPEVENIKFATIQNDLSNVQSRKIDIDFYVKNFHKHFEPIGWKVIKKDWTDKEEIELGKILNPIHYKK